MTNQMVSANGNTVKRLSTTKIQVIGKSYVSYTYHALVGATKVMCHCSAHTRLGKCSHQTDAAAFLRMEAQPVAQPTSSFDAWLAAEEARGNVLWG